MKKPVVRVQLLGDGFSPANLRERTKLPIKSLVEAGEISKSGRFKGKPSPYGFGYLAFGSLADKTLEQYADQLITFKKDLNESYVDEIIFDVYAPNGYINSISLSPSFAGKLIELGARIEFISSDDKSTARQAVNARRRRSELLASIPNFQKYSKLVEKVFNAIENEDPQTIQKLREIL